METLKSSIIPIDVSARPIIPSSISPQVSAANYDKLINAVGDATVVMIGEASHGTHEFYEQRAEITKLLIKKKGFNIITTEADWPDAYRVNRFVQKAKNNADKTAEASLGNFRRFPMWMWRNTVVRDFIVWLREYNDGLHDGDGDRPVSYPSQERPKEQKVAYYGQDLYSMYTSMDAVIEYLDKVDPEDAKKARKLYGTFRRFKGEPQAYGMSAGLGLAKSLEKEVVQTLEDLRRNSENYLRGVGGLIDGDELFYATQNAELVKNAEEYYRQMYLGNDATWNIRDTHMADCIEKLLTFHNSKHPKVPNKIVVWAHNSHIGDAKYTDAHRRGEHNVGQLIREKFGVSKTYNIGFSTYRGTVTAAHQWDDPCYVFKVREALKNTHEELFHSIVDNKNYYLLFRSNAEDIQPPTLEEKWKIKEREERYIGVIYHPHTERASHYSTSDITREYDALIFLHTTHAVQPMDTTTTWMSCFHPTA